MITQANFYIILCFIFMLLIGCALYLVWFTDDTIDKQGIILTLFGISMMLGAVAIILSSYNTYQMQYLACLSFCVAFIVQSPVIFLGAKFNFYCCSGIATLLLLFCFGSLWEAWDAIDKQGYKDYDLQ